MPEIRTMKMYFAGPAGIEIGRKRYAPGTRIPRRAVGELRNKAALVDLGRLVIVEITPKVKTEPENVPSGADGVDEEPILSDEDAPGGEETDNEARSTRQGLFDVLDNNLDDLEQELGEFEPPLTREELEALLEAEENGNKTRVGALRIIREALESNG